MKRFVIGLGAIVSAGFIAQAAAPAAPVPTEPEGLDPEDSAEAPAAVEGAGPAVTPAAPKNPYSSIVVRNPFGLKPEPPPPEPPPPDAPAVTPSALKLTGITTLLGGKRAMFVVEEPGKTNLVSDLVREGDWDTYITNLQVLNIDARAGNVKVVYGGKELALNFKDNGIKPPTMPVPAPGAGGMQPGGMGRPGNPGFVAPQPQPVAAGGFGNQPAAGAATTVVNPPGGSGLRQVPARPSRLGGVSQPTAAVHSSDVQPMSPEQQAISMKAQEIIARQQGVTLPPTPPIPGVDFPPAPGGSTPPPLPGQ